MSADRSLPADLVLRQARASDPVGSAWVSANAGSGKTFLLAQRVIRLLLSGADPGRILCLTFTKAAAAEMAKRVFQILAGWVTLPDKDLAAEIKKTEGRSPNRDQVIAARRLFARALETPGGLKIQTIHSFCERVLHQFPFEANVAGHFQVMEADAANALMTSARAAVLTKAAADPNGALGRAYALLIKTASDKELFDTINAFVSERAALRRWFEVSGSQERAVDQLRAHFDLDASETAAAITGQIPFPDAFNQGYATRIMPLLAGGAKTDQGVAERLRAALAAPEPAMADTYMEIFFRIDKGSRLVPRALSRFATKALKGQIPDLEDRVAAEIDRLSALQQRLYAVKTVETTAAMICIADAVISTYEGEKAARGLLDFDDLIGRTATLLERSEAAPWVHYKLDYGLDHILVDEAQDTSPQQWRVILSLAEEFFAGASARPGTRTIFSVGDEKQSIYSFQGAEPRWFADMRRTFSRRTRDAQLAWHDVTLPLSFRSTPQVLAAVDMVFDDPMIARGVSESGIEPHQAIRDDEDGLVEIWPLVEPDDSALPDDWTVPLDRVQANSPPVRLADKIASHIAAMIRAGETVTKDRRPITPGDVLILVRKRTAFVSAMNRALKEAGLPVAGADRIDLLDHIAVLDLLAVADIALLPEDDLTLAAVLKCPLITLDEDALFALAHGRPGSLWSALESHAKTDQRFAAALGIVSEWRRRADFMPPFEFFARILGPDGGRQAFHRHFGVEADDVLDEFLDRALAFERSEAVPSLQGFLAWLRGGLADIKREVDPERDEVRVMTVHGAKGLEAPIVFLVDTGSAPVHASHRPKMLSLSENGGVADGGPLIWARGATATHEQERAMEGALARIDDEYRRLLYVGMTRARDRLYLCGHRSKRQLPETCWYGLIERILVPAARPLVDADGTYQSAGASALIPWPRRAEVESDQARCHGLSGLAVPGGAASGAGTAALSFRGRRRSNWQGRGADRRCRRRPAPLWGSGAPTAAGARRYRPGRAPRHRVADRKVL